jgi:5-methylcytosine-specific restriction protein A
MRIPVADDFRKALETLFAKSDGSYIEIVSGDLHRLVGGYPGNNHRMPLCCHVMGNVMKPGDI